MTGGIATVQLLGVSSNTGRFIIVFGTMMSVTYTHMKLTNQKGVLYQAAYEPPQKHWKAEPTHFQTGQANPAVAGSIAAHSLIKNLCQANKSGI